MGTVFSVTFAVAPLTRLPVHGWEPINTPFSCTLIVAEERVTDPIFLIVTTGVVGAHTAVEPCAGETMLNICASLKLIAFILTSSMYVLFPNAFVFRNLIIIFCPAII